MIIRHYKVPVKHPIIFYQVNIKDISTDYFINKINQNINTDLSFTTNVKGHMTDWRLFEKDENFLRLLSQIHQENNLDFDNDLKLVDAWGIKMEEGCQTIKHNHIENSISGSFYLNDCDNKIFFPQLKLEIPIEKNTCIFFSSILEHYTTPIKKDTKYAIVFNFNEKRDWR